MCFLMSCHISVPLTTITILLSVIIFTINNYYFSDQSDNELNLFIAILSSRHNFLKRQSLRNTWIKNVDSIARESGLASVAPIHYKFIIGDIDCDIPPEYRYDAYSCDFRDLRYSNQRTEMYLTEYETTLVNTNSFNYIYRGFSFAVHQPIIITRIGIPNVFLVSDQNVSVVLLNAQNKEIITKLNVSSNSTQINEIYYERTKKILLPKNFNGLLLIDSERFNLDVNISLNVNQNENGFLKVLRVYYGFTDYESLKHNPNMLIGATFAYTVSDWNQIESYKQRLNESFMLWNEHISLISEKLSEEINEFDDIILVNLVDVYRNLPLKLLKAFEYSFKHEKLTHFLKTDDDCYINIKNILFDIHKLINTKKLWFGKFRRLWPLEYYGKWAENDYGSPFYPPFACGSGYILSFDLVKWLYGNINELHIFQGEDVSLGIWLSAINPQYKDDIRWLCNTTEYKFQKSFSIPQLNPENIIEMHKILEK